MMYLRSLRFRFFVVFVIIGILPFFAVGILLIRQESKAMKSQASRELVGLSRGLALELDTRLNEMQKNSSVIASLPAIRSMDPAQQDPLLQLLLSKFKSYRQLGIADLTGSLQSATFEYTDTSLSTLPSFQKAAQGEQSWVVLPGLFNDKLILHIHTPIFDEADRLIGVLGSPVALSSLIGPLDSLIIGDGNAFVLDEHRKVLIHPKTAEEAKHRDYSSVLASSASASWSEFGTISYRHDGESWIAGYANVPNYGWTIVTERPVSEILQSTISARNVAGVSLFVSILLCLIIASVMAQWLTLPIQRLAHAAAAFAQDDHNKKMVEVSTKITELASLFSSFQHMRTSVIEREQDLRQFNLAMEASIDGMAILKNHRFAYVNQSLMDLWGTHTQEAMIGHHWIDRFDPVERERIEAGLSHSIPSKRKWRGEARLDGEDGVETYLDISLTRRENGEEILVVRDLAERKQAELAMLDDQKVKYLGLLAGGIAHDFNNILAGMLGQCFIAQKTITANHPAQANMNRIIKSGKRAADLTRQLLAYAGKGTLVIEKLDLSQLIKENVEIMKSTIPSNVQLIVDLAPPPLWIEADRGQIQQIIMNLLINASESIDKECDGVLRIRATIYDAHDEPDYPANTIKVEHSFIKERQADAQFVCLEVYDTGTGMTSETIQHIFDPFFTTKDSGSGLGLSATLGIMQSLKGSLEVRSLISIGTMFRLLFPAMSPTVGYIPKFEHRADLMSQQSPLSSTGTVLLVDDNASLCETLQEILESSGLSVLVASNGLEAVNLYRLYQHEIDFTLLDLRMPIMGGIEALHLIKQIRRDASIVLMSGYSESEIESGLVDNQTVFFMPKPYSFEQLMNYVERFRPVAILERVP